LLALAQQYDDLANSSSGVGIIWALGHAFLSATFGFLGVIFGLVALVRIRSGQCGGQRTALTGIVLGCLPLALVWFLLVGSNPLRW